MSDETLLKPVDVAKRCQVNTKTVLRAIHAGRLRASRLGASGALRVRPADMQAWIDATVVEPPAPAEAPPLRVVGRVSAVGRLVVSPEMGRPSR